MLSEKSEFGIGDNSYNAAGGLVGLTKLVDSFYHYMDSLPEAKVIRAMHKSDLDLSKDKLTSFLSGWLGGPKLYSGKFGGINIPAAHKHLAIDRSEAEAWMTCMQKAVTDQAFDLQFKKYLIEQLRVPVEKILLACGAQ